MPKVELHCHLDGSLPLATIRRLADRARIAVPGGDEALRRRVTVPEHCESLPEYLACFDLAVACLQTDENLYEAAYDVAAAAALENTAYLELRFAPLLHLEGGLTADRVVESVVEGLAAASRDTGIETGLILCAMRHRPEEENGPLLDLASRRLGVGVVSLDLAGDEKRFPAGRHAGFFRRAAEMGIPFTIHAGEADGPESVAAAVCLGAARIGHGIALREDPALLERCREKRIGIELCPVSNLQTRAAESWEAYPFPLFLEKGLAVSVNTDNRTVSGTTLTGEFTALTEHFPGVINEATIEILYRNAVRAAFASGSCKKRLMERWDRWKQEQSKKGSDSHE